LSDVPSQARGNRFLGGIRALWHEHPWGTLVAFLFGGLTVTVLLNAWICDDAYITFRVVDNVIHGYGAVWNVGERVQAYTNPLLMLVMVVFSFVTREVYYTALAISVAASLGAVAILVWKVSRSRVSSVVALLVLVFSGSFIAYSTSGLENCLIFLLAALFFWKYFSRDRPNIRSLLLMTVLFSLSVVNRMDIGLLLAPALAFAFFTTERVSLLRRVAAVLLGLVPLFLWEAFSLVYYGFLFPNTAYAKLNTGIPASEYLVRGVWYYVLSTLQDPIALIAIFLGSALILFARRAKSSVPLIGVALYLAYVLKIGGDFMRGRFLTAPLFVVLLLFVSVDAEQWERLRITKARLLMGVAVLVLAQSLGALTYSAMDFNDFAPYGIYNDKAIYFPSSNLPMNLLTRQLNKSPLVVKGRELKAKRESPVVRATLGFTGYYAGPKIHMVDPLALNDALLARLPAINEPGWHIGHNVRYIPEGYLETVKTGRNQIQDRNLASYYDYLSRVVKGRIWSRERWKAIYDLNTGKYDNLIDQERYRFDVNNELDIDRL
jgi:arabinofuranosyltransferase